MIPKGGIVEEYFRYSENPVIQEIWAKRIKPYMSDPHYPTVF